MIKLIFTFLLCCICILYSNAQMAAYNPPKRPHDWWQADWKKDSLPGISLDQAYEYLKGRISKPVIVAIIDNCVDTAHEELKDFIWTNKKEIPGNGIDDDHNGYVDDMHGWCFIANKNNEAQIKQSSLEMLVYRTWKKKFEHINVLELKGAEKEQYEIYLTAKKMLQQKWKTCRLASLLSTNPDTLIIDSARFYHYLINTSLQLYGDTSMNRIPFGKLAFTNEYDSTANQFFSAMTTGQPKWYIPLKKFIMIPGLSTIVAKIILEDGGYRNTDSVTNFRKVVGDDPDNFKDVGYGTPAINLSEIGGYHATLIAGVIAANRNNGIGIKGIADNVLLMPLVTGVPDAGHIDKDMVLAIHYAVDNGASIINMSIGATPFLAEHWKELKEAFDYAFEHHVLLVNSAGNAGSLMDKEKYLMGQGANGKDHDTYIRVAATTTLMTDSLILIYSNFGKNTVDLFAPGAAIYSTIPGNNYASASGTSLATPVVAGVAALLKSYFPSLTAKQIKEILMKSAYKPNIMIDPPIASGIKNKMPFSKMSKSGGIVNAYNAVKLADEMTRKKNSFTQ